MQNRYVGDIGDYVKLALLRALAAAGAVRVDTRIFIGVVWCLVPDEYHNTDGRHISYLKNANWRSYDPVLFDYLNQIVTKNIRNVEQLQSPELLPTCTFFSEEIPLPKDIRRRAQVRRDWTERALSATRRCNLVFLDPDNGLAPIRYSVTRKGSRKSVAVDELKLFGPDRSLLVYHHQTRRKGGHRDEITWQAGRLKDAGVRQIDALRASPYSPRVFFLLDGTDTLRERAATFSKNWNWYVEWMPDLR